MTSRTIDTRCVGCGKYMHTLSMYATLKELDEVVACENPECQKALAWYLLKQQSDK